MATLVETVLQPEEKRSRVAADCRVLIDNQVRSKGGVSGLAIKGAYKVVKTFKPGFLDTVINGLLDEMVEKLEPHYEAHQAAGGSQGFGQTLAPKSAQVANDLLAVTDEKAEKSTNKTVKKLYARLRPSAQNNVAEAIPALGDLIDSHL